MSLPPSGSSTSTSSSPKALAAPASPASSPAVTKDDPVVPAGTTESARPPFVANFCCLVVFGVALGFWLYFFTDWFDLFGTVLALGGVLAWLPFLIKLLSTRVQERMQERVGKLLFESQWSWVCSLALTGVLFVVSCSSGTLQLDNVQGFGD